MRGRQTVLWTGIGLVAGVVCLGAAEPQPSKGGKAMSSAESSRAGWCSDGVYRFRSIHHG